MEDLFLVWGCLSKLCEREAMLRKSFKDDGESAWKQVATSSAAKCVDFSAHRALQELSLEIVFLTSILV